MIVAPFLGYSKNVLSLVTMYLHCILDEAIIQRWLNRRPAAHDPEVAAISDLKKRIETLESEAKQLKMRFLGAGAN